MHHPIRSLNKLGKRIADRLAEYSAVGWDIDLAMQPTNLPDLGCDSFGPCEVWFFGKG